VVVAFGGDLKILTSSIALGGPVKMRAGNIGSVTG
jgi:hypothetical protein